MTIKLAHSSLGLLPDNVAVPNYDMSALKPGILHIGIGNFHRAHQAVYLDELFNLGLDLDWGLVGAGIMPSDAQMRTKLQAQDWLSTVVDLDEKGLSARVIGVMVDFVDTNPSSLIDALVNSEIKIVSLTITEGGYFVDEKSGGVDLNHRDIQHDIKHPESPKTVFGIMAASLDKRRKMGLDAFTIMSCDNVPHNGETTRKVMLALVNAVNPELAEWINTKVAFPNSMVDCITPATSELEIEKLQNLFDIDDSAPVFCEPFRQWVLEDNFYQGRPEFEKVGVRFVEDVAPFELMKLRILNGGHAAIAFPAALLGLFYVHDAMAESAIDAYLKRMVTNEIIPSLELVPGVEFEEYLKLIKSRFSNPEIKDTISRLCTDSSNRLPKFIFPIIASNIEANRPCQGLAMIVAFWCLYCAKSADVESNIVLIDEHSDRLQNHALLSMDEASAFLDMDDIFGGIGRHPVFVEQFTKALQHITNDGIVSSLESYSRNELP